MFNDKTTTRDPWRMASKPADEDDEAFEIEDADDGGDPYNHTGSFCVPEFEE